MNDRDPRTEMNKALFTNLIMMLSSSTMQQLGKLVNPMTGKTEINLEGAQITIDMLAMIQEKTRGNLDKDENKMLSDILASLQMNYVDAAQSTKTAPQAETPEAAKKDDEAKADSATAGETPAGDKKDKKDPKYHKSYGE